MTGLTRAQMLEAMLAHRAVAAELERLLKDANFASFTAGAVETWKFDGIGVVAGRTTNDAVTVVDLAALIAYVQDTHPSEVVMVPQLRNPKWLDVLFGKLEPVPPVDGNGPWKPKAGETADVVDRDGRVVPGVVWRRGGAWSSVAITPDGTRRRELTEAAQHAVEHGVPMPELLHFGQTAGPATPPALEEPDADI
jgi:hypothetical protein